MIRSGSLLPHLKPEVHMARYVMLLNYTDQGIRHAKDTVKRAAAARQAFEKGGAKISQILWTLGQYDLVLLVEAPGDDTAATLGLQLATLGNVRTTTLPAFDEKEFEQILKKI
jgi:uncharacterized protein with GYD domain